MKFPKIVKGVLCRKSSKLVPVDECKLCRDFKEMDDTNLVCGIEGNTNSEYDYVIAPIGVKALQRVIGCSPRSNMVFLRGMLALFGNGNIGIIPHGSKPIVSNCYHVENKEMLTKIRQFLNNFGMFREEKLLIPRTHEENPRYNDGDGEKVKVILFYPRSVSRDEMLDSCEAFFCGHDDISGYTSNRYDNIVFEGATI